MRKKFLYYIIFIVSLNVYAQELLSNLNTTWSTVLAGKVIAEPVLTSYGFCVVTDSKTLLSFTNSGVLLWEKNIPRIKNPIVSAIPGDFLLIVSENGYKLSLLNPSGSEIWNVKTDFEITNKCIAGRDGRFFVYGDTAIECFGMNGISKWKLHLDNKISDIGLKELPDGSFIAFFSELYNGKTKGFRISPFGEILEEIIFAGNVKSSEYCETGIFLTFVDGSAGFFSLSSDSKTENKWVLNNSKEKKDARFIVSENLTDVFYIVSEKKGITFNEIDYLKGIVKTSFFLENIDYNSIQILKFPDNIFIADKKNACYVSKNGKEIWAGRMPEGKIDSWNYLILTSDNNFIFCCNNWSLRSYSIYHSRQNVNNGKKNYDSFIQLNDTFSSYAYMNFFEESLTSEKRIADLRKGGYGINEIQWTLDLQIALNAFLTQLQSSNFGTRIENSVFDEDTKSVNQLLRQICIFGTDDYAKYTGKLLKNIKNSSFLITVITGINENGYDPNGEILDSLEIVASKISPKNDAIIMRICDAVYSICKFMGRPAFNKKGKTILSNFMFPSYSNSSRNYARTVLTKIKDLDL